MSKRNLLAKTAVAVAILSLSSLASAATTVNGGKVHFTGQIVNAACAVSADSTNQTINMGQYRTALFDAVGKTSGKINFSINLEDCDTTVSENASASFSGVSDSNDKTVLAISNISGGASGAASGVGIELLDHTGKVLVPDGSVYSTAKKLIDGSNTLDFSARYKSTLAQVNPGQADSDVTFRIQYD
ncbi:type 1 fimbrial major subunit FimA [Proteus myxofaciens]|uniref:Type 1 fimbriae major subunit n=1 Tax=Proteus myxofaciens ATCC 19692 TaxID=1354337 RepID=A0A198GP21_9GAMM|nr:type 1 fimbrial major subunit FimA [Proteus myxofaciens]OAT37981.1 type 1 fimbriae major subunit [Proteus myxofaciens ATCC 19692]